MRDFIDIYTFSDAEEFEVVCAMVVDSEAEAGRQLQRMDIGQPAEEAMVLA
jgi:hypothetical protein